MSSDAEATAVLTAQQISDHIEIERVLQRYFQSMDSWDYDLLASVFSAGAVLHYEALEGAQTRYPEMVAQFREFNRHFSFMQHVGNQLLIDLDGDEAHSTSGLRALHVQTARDGSENRWVIYGTYCDRHQRTPEGWRIAERHFRQTHTEGALLPFDQVESYESPPWLQP